MADPATMAIAGAAIGAATNKKNPLEGAMMGAALGGGGGYLLGGAPAAAAVEGAAGAGAAEGLLGAGIDASLGSAYQAAGMGAPTAYPIPGIGVPEIAMMPDQAYAGEMMDAAMGRAMPSSPSFDYDAIARASMGSDLPGASAVAGASPTAAKFNPMMAMQALKLGQPQEQPVMRGGGVKQGDPRSVQQDAVLNLLAPKRLEKRKISLLG